MADDKVVRRYPTLAEAVSAMTYVTFGRGECIDARKQSGGPKITKWS